MELQAKPYVGNKSGGAKVSTFNIPGLEDLKLTSLGSNTSLNLYHSKSLFQVQLFLLISNCKNGYTDI